jgi:hypothetical protein
MYGIDFIVGNELKKIQVKSTFSSDKRYPNKPTYRVKFTKGYDGRAYEDGDFDYAAVYIALVDSWYIIPMADIGSCTLRMNPDNDDCKWNKYNEAWHLINDAPREMHR